MLLDTEKLKLCKLGFIANSYDNIAADKMSPASYEADCLFRRRVLFYSFLVLVEYRDKPLLNQQLVKYCLCNVKCNKSTVYLFR